MDMYDDLQDVSFLFTEDNIFTGLFDDMPQEHDNICEENFQRKQEKFHQKQQAREMKEQQKLHYEKSHEKPMLHSEAKRLKREERQSQKSGLLHLQLFLGLPTSSEPIERDRFTRQMFAGAFAAQNPLDAVFVAIDFEHNSAGVSEIGISTLDTRDLQDHRYTCSQDIIFTQHYRIKGNSKGNYKRLPVEFQFPPGSSIDISQNDAVLKLENLLYIRNDHQKPIRQLLLVGHGFDAQRDLMKRLGIDLKVVPSWFTTFDTVHLASNVFKIAGDMSLGDIVRRTGLRMGNPAALFHNAGNDANCSLRAILLLAIYDYDTSKMEGVQRERVEMYRNIAHRQYCGYISDEERGPSICASNELVEMTGKQLYMLCLGNH